MIEYTKLDFKMKDINIRRMNLTDARLYNPLPILESPHQF